MGYGQGQSNCCIRWLNSQSFKRFFSPSRLLQQKTMITIENDIVAGYVPLWLSGNFYDSFGSIGNSHHLLCVFFVKRAGELTAINEGAAIAAINLQLDRTGSKMNCVELCNFHFCCAFIFCQPMKKFEFFGASRATRQRHFKPKDEWLWGRETYGRSDLWHTKVWNFAPETSWWIPNWTWFWRRKISNFDMLCRESLWRIRARTAAEIAKKNIVRMAVNEAHCVLQL